MNGAVGILFGNGDGTFVAPVNVSAHDFPSAIAIGDLNGDGHQDLAVANLGSGDVTVSLGNGDGTFRTAVGYGTGDGQIAFTSGIAIGDVNGDGIPDVALADPGNSNFSGDVVLLLGNGDGTLQAAVRPNAGAAPYDVAIGDFNGDGLGYPVASSFTADTVSFCSTRTRRRRRPTRRRPRSRPRLHGMLGAGGWYTSACMSAGR